ncbi:Oidioi.mRNA.OKI2018_I69.chr1.g1494.t1.cds [Oikopleura dioica]|uniref:Oidioi.mRNA.OKI2018_I69.chr1.g1494.t1.cds n=1 Tax=Oikopleura dioica TaxID=34765 RepID=A0ABN7SN42_OIKDI|nr:Oidioi.mRNA.OKI2018_I69.chr1.g1494.t1.cds [Oikopleura dioica]
MREFGPATLFFGAFFRISNAQFETLDFLFDLNEKRPEFSPADRIELNLDEGTLIGYETTSQVLRGTKYQFFKQIPYAKSPEGSRRFRKPEPIEQFEGGVYDSVSPGKAINACPGYSFGPDALLPALEDGVITENCLAMDIYRPARTNKTDLPIFIWIHGGGLFSGTSAYYHFARLAQEDIIIAAIQYRLGIHGFLSSYSPDGLTDTPGNFGLLDQQAAIEFVHRNARNLGGDPNKITIGGESAGAWSVGFQLLSDKSAGMIKTAISQSGLATFDMSPQESEYGNMAIKNLCEKTSSMIDSPLNCSESTEEIVDQFRGLNTTEILKLQLADQAYDRLKVFDNLAGYNLANDEITTSKRVRFIPEEDREEVFENYFRLMSDEPWLNCDDIKNCTAQEYQILAAKIMGEMAFVLPSFEHALLYSDQSAELKTDQRETSFPIPAAGHAEDLMFMMDVPNMEVEYDEGSVNLTLWEILHSPSENPYPPKEYMIQMADIFINHWASIIKSGKPESSWNQFTRENMNYVEWTNNDTHALEVMHSGLPPTIKYMIETYGPQETSSAFPVSNCILLVLLTLTLSITF